MFPGLPFADAYRLADEHRLLTPALLVYPDIVRSNIDAVVRLLGGDAGRWRAHVKSAKLRSVMAQLASAGVTHLKCATTLELRVACEAGAADVLLAYPAVGPKVERVAALAAAFPAVSVSALVDTPQAASMWSGKGVGLFVDVNPGMDRTGIPDDDAERILAAVRAVVAAGVRFGGVHYYDGHMASAPAAEAAASAHRGYDRLLEIVDTIEAAGVSVPEIITAGTPAFPWTLSYRGFAGRTFVHRASPGTVVYLDATSAGQLPRAWGLQPAVVVAATVVSHPAPGRVTCDAGHKTVSADAGVPTCAVLGRPDLEPLAPSEEHLPIAVPEGSEPPRIGEVLYLVPRHVCPTVNNFDHAVLVREGRASLVERVAARGREAPLAEQRIEN
ncbi:MAG: D-TA family PLP-dependent enzyme [Acidobacteria bacterium]|nr:MAG: D-TA family PLP-dependent enzyme [Acidobacteriota bacterium]